MNSITRTRLQALETALKMTEGLGSAEAIRGRLLEAADEIAACLAAEGEEDMSVQVADYEIALQRAAAIILKLRGCAEDEIDDQLIASLVDHELREPPAPPVSRG